MYGARTLRIDRDTREIVDRYHGQGKSFQTAKNTSFSALARLREVGRDARVIVTIFENMHAALPIDYASLPACFEVVRAEYATEADAPR
jgi:hypothetical protein